MEPKISIIMGIYNCSDYLEEAVKCVINQTFKEWELIMCDDGSTDSTYKLALQLSKLDKRIKVIKNKKNIGLAASLNHCLKYSKGKYIARMDGDDVCSLNRLEKEYNFLENNSKYSFVSTNMLCYDDNGVFRRVIYNEYPKLSDFIDGSQFCHAGSMILTKVLISINGYSIDKSVERVEDYDLWFRLYENGYIGYNMQEFLYSMRDDRNAIKRRKFIYRINEAKIRKRVFDTKSVSYFNIYKIFIPIIKGFVPTKVYKTFHKRG